MADDERFINIWKDPRFKKIPKADRKVKIDSRFSCMFTDKNFHTKYTVDKRGRPVQATSNEDLEKFYEIENSEEDVEHTPNKKCKLKNIAKNIKYKGDDTKIKQKNVLEEHNKTNDNVEANEADEKNTNEGNEFNDKTEYEEHVSECYDNSLLQTKNQVLPQVSSSSDDDAGGDDNFDDIRHTNVNTYDSDDDSDEELGVTIEQGMVHGWGALDEDATRIEDAETTRLAFCNCDWEKVTAMDLFVLCNSFLQTGGCIKSVKVYPSEFGLEQMLEEDVSGPINLKASANDNGERCPSGRDEGEGQSYHMEKLREYQLNRLKYYYAIVECNSKATADKIYEECDGMEYELSATRLDIRFVPDETTFEHEPRDVATEMPAVGNYQPTTFLNTALQQSTVRLTWDEPDVKRMQVTNRQFTRQDIENMDFQDYIASSSEDEDVHAEVDDEKKNIRMNKYRALVDMLNEKEKEGREEEDNGEMEVTWEPGKTLTGEKIVMKKVNSNDSSNIKEKKPNKNKELVNDENKEGDYNDSEIDDENNGTASGFDDPFFTDINHDGKNAKENKKKKKKKNPKNLENAGDDEEGLTKEQKKSKASLSLLLMNEDESGKKHFSMPDIEKAEKLEKKKKKRKIQKKAANLPIDDDFELNVSDERFSAIYNSHMYALDPSEPHFKRTKATEAILTEAEKRRKLKGYEKSFGIKKTEYEGGKEAQTLNPSLSSLVKSVKGKTQNHLSTKKRGKVP